MLTLLPNAYPDELFFSIVARHIRRCGSASVSQILRDIIPSSKAINFLFAPREISSGVIIGTAEANIDYVSRLHSLDPLYSRWAKAGAPQPHRFASADAFYRKGARGFRAFCQSCAKSDKQTFGETYWRRLHQAPGIDECLIHGEPLCLGEPVNSHNFRVFSLPDASKRSVISVICPSSVTPLLVGHYTSILISGWPQKCKTERYTLYRSRLSEAGYLKDAWHIDYDRLHRDMYGLFGRAFFAGNSIDYEPRNPNNWVRTLITANNSRTSSPLQHAVISAFLESRRAPCRERKGITVQCGINAPHSAPVCLTVRWRTSAGKRRAIVRCSCGSIYSSTRQKDGRYIVARLIDSGTALARRVGKEFHNGKSIRSIARLLQIPRNAVCRIVKPALAP